MENCNCVTHESWKAIGSVYNRGECTRDDGRYGERRKQKLPSIHRFLSQSDRLSRPRALARGAFVFLRALRHSLAKEGNLVGRSRASLLNGDKRIDRAGIPLDIVSKFVNRKSPYLSSIYRHITFVVSCNKRKSWKRYFQ